MRAMDWVGILLIGGVVAGGAFYFVKMRPLDAKQQAGNGMPVPAVPQGSFFVAPPAASGGNSNSSQGANDFATVTGAISNLTGQLFPNGIGGLFS